MTGAAEHAALHGSVAAGCSYALFAAAVTVAVHM